MTKCLKALFTASLILNVLLLGLVGGHFIQSLNDHPWWEDRQDLKPESQNHVAAVFQGAFREIREVGDEARKSRAEMVKILSAEKFDEKAFDQTARELAKSKEQMTEIKMKATKEAAKELSQEERTKMAERMTRMIGGGWERHVRRDRQPPEMNKRMGGDNDAALVSDEN